MEPIRPMPRPGTMPTGATGIIPGTAPAGTDPLATLLSAIQMPEAPRPPQAMISYPDAPRSLNTDAMQMLMQILSGGQTQGAATLPGLGALINGGR